MEKSSEKGYIEEFKDYQGKQFLPGYFAGGTIHPALSHKTKSLAFLLLLLSLVWAVAAGALIAFNGLSYSIILPVLVCLLLTGAAVRTYKNAE